MSQRRQLVINCSSVTFIFAIYYTVSAINYGKSKSKDEDLKQRVVYEPAALF